jgi:single-strand DNA-binding protein
MVNSVNLIGNVATEIDLKELGSDRTVASFVLAVDRPGSEKTDFFRVTAWNKQAEVCGRFLAKGRRVGVDGKLRSRSWEDGDGKKRSAVEVLADQVIFLTPPDRDGG